LFAQVVSGATRAWIGGNGSNWTTAANWGGGVAPSAGDDLVFPGATPFRSVNNDFPADTLFQSITIQADQYVLSGNRVLLGAGGLSSSSFFPFVNILLPISLAASQTWHPLFFILGDIDLNGNTLTLDPLNDNGFVSGSIVGTGNVVQVNTGGMAFEGINTFVGTFTHTGAGSTSMLGFLGGRLDAPYTQTAGVLDISSDGTVGNLIINAGTFSVGTGSSGPVSARGNSGNITLTVATRYFEVVESSLPNGFGNLHVTGSVVLGGATLQLLGTGSVHAGDQLLLIENDGVDPVVGTFLGLPEGVIIASGPGGFRYSISYAGGTGNDVVLTVLTSVPTITTLQSSRNPSPPGSAVTFTATVTGSGSPTGSVTFFDNGTPIGSSALNASGNATITTSTLTVGLHTITAMYSGDTTFAPSTSAVLIQSVATLTPALGPMATAMLFLVLALVGAFVARR
jgi:hypothetical protein